MRWSLVRIQYGPPRNGIIGRNLKYIESESVGVVKVLSHFNLTLHFQLPFISSSLLRASCASWNSATTRVTNLSDWFEIDERGSDPILSLRLRPQCRETRIDRSIRRPAVHKLFFPAFRNHSRCFENLTDACWPLPTSLYLTRFFRYWLFRHPYCPKAWYPFIGLRNRWGPFVGYLRKPSTTACEYYRLLCGMFHRRDGIVNLNWPYRWSRFPIYLWMIALWWIIAAGSPSSSRIRLGVSINVP